MCRLEWVRSPWWERRKEALPVVYATGIKAYAQGVNPDMRWAHPRCKMWAERETGVVTNDSGVSPHDWRVYHEYGLWSSYTYQMTFPCDSRNQRVSTLWLEGIWEISVRGSWEPAKLNIIAKTLGWWVARLKQGSPGLCISPQTNGWFPGSHHKTLLEAICIK